MRVSKSFIALAFVAASTVPATARSLSTIASDADAGGDIPSALIQPRAAGNLECVPYARNVSGIQIYGDAHTWWGQAKGRYATGRMPRVGAVMAVEPHNNSRLGHVATVSRIVDSRTILLSHANWSYRGQIERNVTALDVSDNNDWSEVRIWYGPAHNLGTTHWPVSGFIYNAKPGAIRDRGGDLGSTRLASVSRKSPSPTGKARAGSGSSDPIGRIIDGQF